MDWEDIYYQLLLGTRAPPNEARIQDRLRSAFDASGPLWGAPGVRGLPPSMVPLTREGGAANQERMAPLYDYLNGLGAGDPRSRLLRALTK